MNKEQFKQLKAGDPVSHKADRSQGYIVHCNYGNRVTAVKTVDITNPAEWDLVAEYEREQPWLSVEEFQLEPNEGECFIVLKGRVVMAYHDHKGYFLCSKNSIDCYMKERITKARTVKYPDKPDL